MPSAPLLSVEDELGVAAGVEHADEAPSAAYIVLLDLRSPSPARLAHSGMVPSACSLNSEVEVPSSISCSVDGWG